jgi:hypothetical protein
MTAFQQLHVCLDLLYIQNPFTSYFYRQTPIISPNAIVLIENHIFTENKGRFWFYLIDYKYTGVIFLSNMNNIGFTLLNLNEIEI